jgi:acetoin:2,6-dichlorophenolindophenol oxidoreductase subunit alpha
MSKYDIPKEMLLKMLYDMFLARAFEEKVNEMFMQGKIHGTTHLGVGQEALAGGVSNALRPEDWIQPTHRGHGHCIAKSGNVKSIMAELFGKNTGTCKGIGGSMHIADVSAHNMGTSGIVGGTFPIAVGMGLALKMQKKDSIVTCIFGDAANNQGTFHESLNLASIWKLPILFLCENNMYGMSVPIAYSMAVDNVAVRGASYDIPSKIIDGNNVLEVYSNVAEIAEYIRSGNGPFLLECKTYRWLGHSKSDPRKYRTKEEEKEWKDRCPLKFFKGYLLENGHITESEFEEMSEQATEAIEEAVRFAESSPYSDLNDLKNLVYA